MPLFFSGYFFFAPICPIPIIWNQEYPFCGYMPGTVTNLLKELNWILLKVRRTILRLTLFHKAINRDGGLAFPYYVMKRRRHLRNRSQNNCIELLPNTETYKNSYFCRTVKDWNVLRSEIVNIKSADRLKKVLFERFSQWWILILYIN